MLLTKSKGMNTLENCKKRKRTVTEAITMYFTILILRHHMGKRIYLLKGNRMARYVFTE